MARKGIRLTWERPGRPQPQQCPPVHPGRPVTGPAASPTIWKLRVLYNEGGGGQQLKYPFSILKQEVAAEHLHKLRLCLKHVPDKLSSLKPTTGFKLVNEVQVLSGKKNPWVNLLFTFDFEVLIYLYIYIFIFIKSF